MNKKINKILAVIFVPSVLLVVYLAYLYLSRSQKEKKILDEINNQLNKNQNQISGLNEQVISKWKKELKKLKSKDFDKFFNYFIVTIPYGKIKSKDNNSYVWLFESTNPDEFKIIMEEGINAIKGNEIEKLFQAITPDK